MSEDKVSLTLSIIGLLLFVGLSLYLLTQDVGVVGPI